MSLYIVATPIGNLEDITIRALKVLKEVDLIAAEDTRHTKILLNKYEIDTALISYHSHSGQAKIDKLIETLKEGKSVAVVSDAGTPGISDPAYTIIQAALENDIEIIPLPGASSLLAALVKSGLPINKFLYIGFPPVKKGRQTLFKSLAEQEYTIVMFESPHRLVKTLQQILELMGDRKISLCRELTKIHEEAIRSTVSEAIDYYKERKPRGEYVLVIGELAKS